MARFQVGDVGVALSGEDRLEAVPVVVGEAQLRAAVRALRGARSRANQPASTRGPAARWSRPLGAVLTRLAVLVERRRPRVLAQRLLATAASTYNRRRLHSPLGYLSPVDYENRTLGQGGACHAASRLVSTPEMINEKAAQTSHVSTRTGQLEWSVPAAYCRGHAVEVEEIVSG